MLESKNNGDILLLRICNPQRIMIQCFLRFTIELETNVSFDRSCNLLQRSEDYKSSNKMLRIANPQQRVTVMYQQRRKSKEACTVTDIIYS